MGPPAPLSWQNSPYGCLPSGTARLSFGKNWAKQMFPIALPLKRSPLPENWFGKKFGLESAAERLRKDRLRIFKFGARTASVA